MATSMTEPDPLAGEPATQHHMEQARQAAEAARAARAEADRIRNEGGRR